jgi:hypothetical protein
MLNLIFFLFYYINGNVAKLGTARIFMEFNCFLIKCNIQRETETEKERDRGRERESKTKRERERDRNRNRERESKT